LPGEHHFYMPFDTTAEGVRLSPRMLAQYPKEITIVLQHQFWDLDIKEDSFEVGLSFGGVAERLGVPFAAIKGFFDPSVQFGLQFEQVAETAASQDAPLGAAPSTEPHEGKAARPPAEHRHKRPRPAVAVPPPPANPSPGPDPDKPDGGGEVVRFDRF